MAVSCLGEKGGDLNGRWHGRVSLLKDKLRVSQVPSGGRILGDTAGSVATERVPYRHILARAAFAIKNTHTDLRRLQEALHEAKAPSIPVLLPNCTEK
jgi:hypothetical protein